VIEPNSEPTWISIRTPITDFLHTIWRNGALMGMTQDEAFCVKCDRTTMTQDDLDNGRLQLCQATTEVIRRSRPFSPLPRRSSGRSSSPGVPVPDRTTQTMTKTG